MKEFERQNTREMIEKRNEMQERYDLCRSIHRRAWWLRFVYWWSPSRMRRLRSLMFDSRQAMMLYKSGMDVLNQHEGMKVSEMR